ncbi:MAG: serine protease [bacterium]
MRPLRHRRRAVSRLLLALCLASEPLAAQERSAATSDVFQRYADHVVKIQVVEEGSAAKASIGSGFFVTAAGHVVTNYHVISSLINAPSRYRAQLIESDGTARPITVLAIDVIHDLAILDSKLRDRPRFTLGDARIAQGNRLFSLGHPRDLGLSIVEGTYNGLLLHTLYPRIHLTGSLNPGMSGGPTIDEAGRVIGVNVSTAGNQVSFLVPVDRAVALLERALAPGTRYEAPSLAQVGRQLREYQDVYLRDMFDAKTKLIDFGPFRVATQPAPFFRCWANSKHEQELPYEKVLHNCATDDDIFLDDDQSTGSVTLGHELVSTKTLNAARFYSLYTKLFISDNSPSGVEEYVTSWKCRTRNVKHGDATMRAVLCMRRYRKLGALYDGYLKLAMLGRSDVGLVTTLTMTGVTFDNVDRLSSRYLRLVAWR